MRVEVPTTGSNPYASKPRPVAASPRRLDRLIVQALNRDQQVYKQAQADQTIAALDNFDHVNAIRLSRHGLRHVSDDAAAAVQRKHVEEENEARAMGLPFLRSPRRSDSPLDFHDYTLASSRSTVSSMIAMNSARQHHSHNHSHQRPQQPSLVVVVPTTPSAAAGQQQKPSGKRSPTYLDLSKLHPQDSVAAMQQQQQPTGFPLNGTTPGGAATFRSATALPSPSDAMHSQSARLSSSRTNHDLAASTQHHLQASIRDLRMLGLYTDRGHLQASPSSAAAATSARSAGLSRAISERTMALSTPRLDAGEKLLLRTVGVGGSDLAVGSARHLATRHADPVAAGRPAGPNQAPRPPTRIGTATLLEAPLISHNQVHHSASGQQQQQQLLHPNQPRFVKYFRKQREFTMDEPQIQELDAAIHQERELTRVLIRRTSEAEAEERHRQARVELRQRTVTRLGEKFEDAVARKEPFALKRLKELEDMHLSMEAGRAAAERDVHVRQEVGLAPTSAVTSGNGVDGATTATTTRAKPPTATRVRSTGTSATRTNSSPRRTTAKLAPIAGKSDDEYIDEAAFELAQVQEAIDELETFDLKVRGML